MTGTVRNSDIVEVHTKRDGLLLVCAHGSDFLTWRERMALFIGWETPSSLARKRFPTLPTPGGSDGR